MNPTGNECFLKRGEYYDPLASVNEPDVGYTALMGRDYWFRDINLLSTNLQGDRAPRSGEPVLCRLCKNNSGVVLPAKRIVIEDPDVPGSITGLAAIGDIGKRFMVVDEYLSSSVPVNGLFLAVRQGKTLTKTDAGVSAASLSAGELISPATGGFANGSADIEADGAITFTTINLIRSMRLEARTAYTGGATGIDIDTYVHGLP